MGTDDRERRNDRDDRDGRDRRDEVAWAARVLTRLGYLDLRGHVSARVGDSAIAVTGDWRSLGGRLPSVRAADIAVVTPGSGGNGSGDYSAADPGESAQPELALDTAIYAAFPDAGCVVFCAPSAVSSFAAARRRLVPVMHTGAAIAYAMAPVVEPVGRFTGPERVRAVVSALRASPVCLVGGIGLVIRARDVLGAVNLCHSIERLARRGLDVLAAGGSPEAVSEGESASIEADRALGSDVQRIAQRSYFDSFDRPGPGGEDCELDPAPAGENDEASVLRRRVAQSCRLLGRQPSLVEFREHVSMIDSGRRYFAMSPALDFRTMSANDVSLVGMAGEGEWIGGPWQPTRFSEYHRALFAARGDVAAIVHTHPDNALALELVGKYQGPVTTLGVSRRDGGPVPPGISPTATVSPSVTVPPSMMFRLEDRAAALDAACGSRVIVIRAHGIDYLAGSIEEATVAAVLHERESAIVLRAESLGGGVSLGEEVVAELAGEVPPATCWWEFYRRLGA